MKGSGFRRPTTGEYELRIVVDRRDIEESKVAKTIAMIPDPSPGQLLHLLAAVDEVRFQRELAKKKIKGAADE